VTLLNGELKKVLTAPDQVRLYRDRGLDIVASSIEECTAHLETEQKKWGRVIKERGIRAE
jgi:tripartite-type tricarboxylate transporter receptor subunit TctC